MYVINVYATISKLNEVLNAPLELKSICEILNINNIETRNF